MGKQNRGVAFEITALTLGPALGGLVLTLVLGFAWFFAPTPAIAQTPDPQLHLSTVPDRVPALGASRTIIVTSLTGVSLTDVPGLLYIDNVYTPVVLSNVPLIPPQSYTQAGIHTYFLSGGFSGDQYDSNTLSINWGSAAPTVAPPPTVAPTPQPTPGPTPGPTPKPPPTPAPVIPPTPFTGDPQLHLYTDPDRFPLVANGIGESRPVFIESLAGDNISGESGTLYIDGVALSNPVSFAGALTNVTFNTIQEHTYQVKATIRNEAYETNVLRIEWRAEPPLIDQDGIFERLPGGANFVAFLVPVVFSAIILAATRSALPSLAAFYVSFAVLAVLTPVNPIMWVLVALSAVGIVLAAYSVGFGKT